MEELLAAAQRQPSAIETLVYGLLGLGFIVFIVVAIYRAGKTRGELDARKGKD